MMRLRTLIAAACLAAATVAAHAVQPQEMLADPEQEARAREISKELRCLVCRNENIDDSNAGLARDLRLLVRERISAGDTNEETLDYIVDRYGEFVLLRPPLNAGNLLLWFAGPALLLLGGAGAWVYTRRRSRATEAAVARPAPLTEAEKRRLAELTEGTGR